MKNISTYVSLIGLMFALSSNVQAGLYTDDLSRCLVESTTTEDKISLVKWMFTAASLHPAVSSISSVSEAQLDDANKATAELFVKLLTETCREKAQKAVKYEGQVALRSGFEVLGKVAAGELFASPEVSAGMAGLAKHIDSKKLEDVFSENTAN